jgi:hypothetical protein
MTADDDAPVTQWVELNGTKKFLHIESLSGCRRFLLDEEGYHAYLEPNQESNCSIACRGVLFGGGTVKYGCGLIAG